IHVGIQRAVARRTGHVGCICRANASFPLGVVRGCRTCSCPCPTTHPPRRITLIAWTVPRISPRQAENYSVTPLAPTDKGLPPGEGPEACCPPGGAAPPDQPHRTSGRCLIPLHVIQPSR